MGHTDGKRIVLTEPEKYFDRRRQDGYGALREEGWKNTTYGLTVAMMLMIASLRTACTRGRCPYYDSGGIWLVVSGQNGRTGSIVIRNELSPRNSHFPNNTRPHIRGFPATFNASTPPLYPLAIRVRPQHRRLHRGRDGGGYSGIVAVSEWSPCPANQHELTRSY